jgi:nucleoside permease NupC
MNPSEKYNKLLGLISKGAKFMGIDVMNLDYKPNYRTAITYVLIFFVNLSSIYTFISSFPELIPMLKSVVTYGMVVQVIMSNLASIRYEQSLHLFSVDIQGNFCSNL